MVYINKDKLSRFSLNKNNFYVVMDFDSTITTSDSLGSWSVLENPNFVNPKLIEESHKLIEKYYPIELDYTLDEKAKSVYMQEWYTKNMELFYTYGLTNDTLLNCIKNSNIKFRSGVKIFFNNLFNDNIPVIILSAGIGNVITELLKLHNCFYDNIHIISNFIKFNNNSILPFTDKIIHTSNKCINSLPVDFNNKINNKEYILLFGDLIEDLKMVSKEDLNRTLSFGFLEKNVSQNLELYKKDFDVVLTNNSSFYDIEDILKTII